MLIWRVFLNKFKKFKKHDWPLIHEECLKQEKITDYEKIDLGEQGVSDYFYSQVLFKSIKKH
jgi:hypothetical protein